ncbi:MAG TPA: DUF5675 family protein [Pricia sp.]|nr:DUF5675 family protein [Pricia sp.]
MKYRFLLTRHWQDRNQTFGTLVVFDNTNRPVYASAVIERGYVEGDHYNSCFVAGTYPLIWEWSPKFGEMLWEIKETPHKTECKIHVANTYKQLQGCICPGIKMKDIDNDGYIDVTSSRDTLDQLHRATKGQKEAIIEVQEWL